MTSATTTTAASDLVDRLAGLSADRPLQVLRHERDKVAAATQGSDDALFDPGLIGLSLAERLLVALYACRLTPAPELVAHYLARAQAALVDANEVAVVAEGAVESLSEPRLKALLAFTAALTVRPADGDRAALRALLAAGITTAAGVAVAQLIAFVSYQTRLVAGLRAMRAAGGSTDASTTSASGAGKRSAPLSGAKPRPGSHGFTTESVDWSAWLDVVELDAATPAQIAVLEESHPQAKVSEYYRVLVHQPEILRQRSAAFNAIMYAPGGLARAERELAATVVSRINGCVYCASVHAQRFEQLAKRNDAVMQVFADPDHAGTSERERAIVHFSIELTEAPGELSAASIEPLRRADLAPLEILDLIHSIAIFAWANRLMLNLGEPVRPAPSAA